MQVTVVGLAYLGPGWAGRHSYDPFEVALFVKGDEVRVVGDDEVLAWSADLAAETALYGGLQVHGWLIEDGDPAWAVSQECAQDQGLLYARA